MSDSEGPTPTRRGLLVGAGAAASAAAVGTAGAQEGNQSDGGGGGETHTVDMTDGLVFDPDSITIAPGDTVVWENVGNVGHTVTAYDDGIPEGAAYFASGGYESQDAASSAYFADSGGNVPGGESYSHTFETLGTYEYYCIPHEGSGMLGTVEVVEGGPAPEPSYVSPVTDSFKTIGAAVIGAMIAVLVFSFAFLKFGGREEHSGRE